MKRSMIDFSHPGSNLEDMYVLSSPDSYRKQLKTLKELKMKRYLLILTAILMISVLACRKKDVLDIRPENAVYMGNQSNTGVIAITVSDENGGAAVVTPRVANITNKPVTVTLGIDQKLLDDYNKANNLELQPMAAEDFVFVTKDGKKTHGETTVTIEPGDFEASATVKIDSLNVEKYPYSKRLAIPVMIKSVNGLKLLSSPTWTLVRLNRQLKTSVGLMSGGNIVVRPKTPFEPMKEWTFQMSMIYSTLTRSNLTTAYIQNHGGGEFYTRINATSGIQIKNGRDGDDTWTQKPLNAGQWLHIAYVYKEGSVSVYVNGELQKTFETTPIYLNNTANSGWAIGNEGYNNDYIREVRFWNRALTQAEIMDKLYLPQDPATPGLLMYMPFTKEAQLNELTGNWTVIKDNNTRMSFVDNVLFPAAKLEIAE